AAWLRDLSDGFVEFDNDVLRKLPGPVSIRAMEAAPIGEGSEINTGEFKPYYIGSENQTISELKSLPEFKWEEKEGDLRRTPIFETHQRLGAKIIPFAGWEMPVWYT
ncbi:MAG: hypothetical protein WA997_09815, partial [Anaerolineales bacterium]